MIDEIKSIEPSPFIDCSISTPNPGSYTHTDCDIIKIEHKRPHSLSHNSCTALYLKCKACGHRFTQYIV